MGVWACGRPSEQVKWKESFLRCRNESLKPFRFSLLRRSHSDAVSDFFGFPRLFICFLFSRLLICFHIFLFIHLCSGLSSVCSIYSLYSVFFFFLFPVSLSSTICGERFSKYYKFFYNLPLSASLYVDFSLSILQESLSLSKKLKQILRRSCNTFLFIYFYYSLFYSFFPSR